MRFTANSFDIRWKTREQIYSRAKSGFQPFIIIYTVGRRRLGRSLLVSCAFLTRIKIHRLLDHLPTCSHCCCLLRLLFLSLLHRYFHAVVVVVSSWLDSCCFIYVCGTTVDTERPSTTDIHPLKAMQCDLSECNWDWRIERRIHVGIAYVLLLVSCCRQHSAATTCVGLCLYLGNMERRIRLRDIASRFPSVELPQSKLCSSR